MNSRLVRVGTIYLPVKEVEVSARWYKEKLGAEISYIDNTKAILNFADQSFFLVQAPPSESANFKDSDGEERFSITFEVDGIEELQQIYEEFNRKQIKVGKIEDRGHAGRNFIFQDLDDNKFDVWSELSPKYKERLVSKNV
ncbi:VOC family protein [Ureibacillus chungkukjangi]|uniref:Glyoxalase/bleomycin resistance protein/dioxygenase superfamily protein n=1 Tax=Ureibacillus chungkukjangi TaxID=1202712 RepID=A0A318TQN4_9BACL|nr:VOC family protein [Ureibacillus chungkukjangi]MCM3388753.1 VOC family protein [Ureibacillus chungkukjangi]PYF06663.1 glyoxalase/bleomycin resistance protein/dioxygenase superfamily protein [Ureibacillus chungkukjangi]HCG4536601.1 VOC family protein [Salmonella enterica subsp. enterica serovar Typhi str. AG3]